MNPYANSRIYGPYVRTDGRKHVVVIFPCGQRKTVSYPKYLVESSIGRTLTKYEEVHHINSDITDNTLENFEIVNKVLHAKLHVKRIISQDFLCPVCGIEFSLSGYEISRLVTERKRGKSKTGPFCSRSCSGVGSNLRTEVRKEYFTLLSLQDESSEVNPANSGKSVIDDNPELD